MSPILENAISVAAGPASNALSARIEKLMGLLFDAGPTLIKSSYEKGKFLIDRGLPSYLRANYVKCETIRTLLKRDAPVLLSDVYVQPKFQIDGKVLSGDDLLRFNWSHESPVVVTGLAGSGKSVFLKWAFNQVIERGFTFYPIFFELRNLPQDFSGGLIDEIYDSVAKFSEDFSREQFEFGLRRGLVYLFIDAFDEAPASPREKIYSELCDIIRLFPKTPVLLTSRPKEEFRYWPGFTEAHLLPFDRIECKEYIGRIEFDPDRKDVFLEALTEEFFEKHREFLSNALLASMMLLTFDEFGEIPERRHIFYQKCFDVLIREHDLSKGKYRRKLASSLDHSEIERLFQAFCALSYLDERYVFSSDEFVDYLQDAAQFCGVSVDISTLSDDFCDSLSVIQKDGDHFQFVHRSFQEYFFVRFCITDKTHSLFDKAVEISKRQSSLGLLDMIGDMDADQFNFDLILPVLYGIAKKCQEFDPRQKPDLVFKLFCESIGFRADVADEEEMRLSSEYSAHLTHSSGPLRALMMLRIYTIFYHHRINVAGLRRVRWPSGFTYAELRERLLKAGKRLPKAKRADFEIEFSLTHQSRKYLIELGIGDFAFDIVDVVRSGIQFLEDARARKLNSLADRMRRR